MCDVNQLKNAIQQLAVDPQASQFVTQVFQADNFQFLKLVTQILLSPDLPDKIMTNSITLISIVLRPSLTRPIDKIAENYFTFSEEERNQVKQATILGLMNEDRTTRLGYAYCLGLIVEIEKKLERMSKSTRGKTIFDQYLIGLIQNQPTPYAPIGSIMAITQILENGTFKTKVRRYQNLSKIILDVGYTVLSKSDQLDNNLILEFKIECARCIDQALKCGLLDEIMSAMDQKVHFLEVIIPNTSIHDSTLHKNLMNALESFIIVLYKRYLNYDNYGPETILPFVEQIFKNTIQPVSAIKNENFDLQETELYVRNVIDMWSKIASFEFSNTYFDSLKELNITELIASNMDELLFSFISTLPVEDLLDINPENSTSYFAYQCLSDFSKVAPSIVFNHSMQVYQASIHNENRQSIFVSFVAAQIIFEIKIPSNSEEQIPNLTYETLFTILSDVIKFTSSNDPSIVSASYAAIITACESHPKLCEEPNFFSFVIQSISNSIQSESIPLIDVSLLAFISLIKPFSRDNPDSNLSNSYQYVLQMLMSLIPKIDINSNGDILYNLYYSICSFISNLPQSVPPQEVIIFAMQIQEQMKKLAEDHQEGGLQMRAFLSIIVYGIVNKLQEDILEIAPGFLNILVTTCEEINSTKANINSLEEVILAIGIIISYTGNLAEPLFPRILDIAINSLSEQNSSLVNSSSQLLTFLLKNFRDHFINTIPNIFELLMECLYSNISNESAIFFIFRAMIALLNVGYIERQDNSKFFKIIGQIIAPRRVELMSLASNLIYYLQVYQKNDEENAECIFSILLQLFTEMMRIYSYESRQNPNDTLKSIPSDFLVSFQDQFIEVVCTADLLKIWSDSIGYHFLDYVSMIINTFGTSYHMNVKIHKPGFKNYFDRCLDGDDKLRRVAISVKDIYDKA
ncbi:hypothetical protein M9Y10_035001 [Tritrichomonas musculus]|uniref:Importin N-terminal domain-containing protein n=1 Tax=Tritrichomonas musculus TaxID=1915356 RepID=A0ABR2KGE8_9EUKA